MLFALHHQILIHLESLESAQEASFVLSKLSTCMVTRWCTQKRESIVKCVCYYFKLCVVKVYFVVLLTDYKWCRKPSYKLSCQLEMCASPSRAKLNLIWSAHHKWVVHRVQKKKFQWFWTLALKKSWFKCSFRGIILSPFVKLSFQ